MKIFYLIAKSEQGGAQTHVFQLSRFFVEKGDKVAVMTSNEDSWLGEEVSKLGVKFFVNKHIGNTLNPFKVLLSFWEIRKAIKKFNPDIVHCHSFMGGLLGRLVVRGKIPTVFTPHGWGFNVGTPFSRKMTALIFEKINSHFTDKIICVSEFGKKLALNFKIAKPSKFTVIYNGIEDVLPTVRCAKKKNNIVNFMFVGRLTEPKDPIFLLSAITKLKPKVRKKVVVTIVGKGEKAKDVKNFVLKHKIEKQVFLTGVLSRQDVFENLCNEADVFVLISRWEGLPITVLEAMSAGLPVIVSKVGGIPELVSEKEGFLIKRGDSKEMVKAITKLVKDESTRREMGNRARAKIKRNFTLSKMFDKVENVYNDLLK
jgi:glycosyltransferase involved in cell wall biosynthesis